MKRSTNIGNGEATEPLPVELFLVFSNYQDALNCMKANGGNEELQLKTSVQKTDVLNSGAIQRHHGEKR